MIGEELELKIDGETVAGAEPREMNVVCAGKKKRLTVMGVEFVYVYLFGIICAFIGWSAENAVRMITQGVLDSRFHILPFLSPYAMIPFAYQILLGDPDEIAVFGRKLFKERNKKSIILSNVTCLGLMYMAVFLGELAVGNAWDDLFGVQLWNYNSLPLHVTQYSGLIPAVGYGTGAYLIFRFIYKPVMCLFKKKVSFKVAKAICLSLGVLIILDTLFMGVQIALFNQPPVYWSVKLW